MWPSVVMRITMGYLFHVWGGVGVGLFFLVISICTELLCFGRAIGITCSLIIVFGIFGGPEKGLGRSKTHPDWMATEEAATVEAVLW